MVDRICRKQNPGEAIGRVGEADEDVSQIKSRYDTVVTLVLAPQANKNLLCRDTIPHPI
jgi:hypothetical protein